MHTPGPPGVSCRQKPPSNKILDWVAKHPPEKRFPTTLPKELERIIQPGLPQGTVPASVRHNHIQETPREMQMRRGPNLGTCATEVPRRRGGPPAPAFNWEASFDTTNAPHLITLLRRIGPGFTPQPRDKLEKEGDDDGTDEDDLAWWGSCR